MTSAEPNSENRAPAHSCAPESTQGPDDGALKLEYEEICRSHQAIADFRGRLLGLLPLASGAGIFLLLNDKISKVSGTHLIAAGLFGTAITLGLYLYESRGMAECLLLRERGGRIECMLHIPEHCSRFQGNTPRFVSPQGAGPVVYFAVVAAWLFVAVHGFAGSRPNQEKMIGWVIVVAYTIAVLIAARVAQASRARRNCIRHGPGESRKTKSKFRSNWWRKFLARYHSDPP